MMNRNRTIIIMAAILVILGVTMLVFVIRDNDKKGMIERKTGYSVPSDFKIEKFVKYGSLFKRTGFEAKILIDTHEHLEETIVTLRNMLGDDYHEIPLKEYNISKYSLFSDTKLVPEPVEISWVIVGPSKSGTLVCFLDLEEIEPDHNIEYYMYMFYND